MKTDPIRIKSYFAEIRKNSSELSQLIDQNELRAESLPLKAAKYLAEVDVYKNLYQFE